VLTPVTAMQLFLLHVLHGNTACSHLPHLSGLRFTAAAYWGLLCPPCVKYYSKPLPAAPMALEKRVYLWLLP
jgi:hypothetical protein